MIPRYARAPMEEVFSETRKFDRWLDIEIQTCLESASAKILPPEAAQVKELRTKLLPKFTQEHVEDILKIEQDTKHDLFAFLVFVEQRLGPPARFLHFGLTSSDVLDTGFALQLREASDLLEEGIESVKTALRRRAEQHKMTKMAGRSHGMFAEPITFGTKLAGFHAEFDRNAKRLQAARKTVSVCKLSGAVGSFAHLPPEIEARVAHKLGLQPETIATQIIPRDRFAEFFTTLALIAGAIERLATELRHLQRSEVGEAQEGFADGQQKGSSCMPHKKNPVLSENLTGLARLVRGYALPALENITLWHERDISHSSVERVIAPDACQALDFALHRLADIITNLEVNTERMAENLEARQGLEACQNVMLALIVKGGMERQRAHAIVQRATLSDKGFKLAIAEDQDVQEHLNKKELEKALDTTNHYRHIDEIFAHAFENSITSEQPRENQPVRTLDEAQNSFSDGGTFARAVLASDTPAKSKHSKASKHSQAA